MSNIKRWLEGLGLAQYGPVFAENVVDIDVVSDLTDADLERLGIPLGDRKRMLRAIAGCQESGSTPRTSITAATIASPHSDGERRHLTVLFCDLVGSTGFAVELDPEELSGVIRRFQDTCAAVVKHFGGYIGRFMGDGLLVYFGYPQAHEDDAERAVRAGLDIVAKVGELLLPSGEPLQVRVGIATGLVVVGETIGEGSAQEQVVFGETPNRAAHLQRLAAPNSVLVAASTHQLLGGMFVCADLGRVEVKGKSRPVAAWRVIGECTVESRFEATRSEWLTRFVGRQEELDQLQTFWQKAKRVEGQLVLLCGEPGIGKSRISNTLLDSIAEEPHIKIRYQCSPHHTNSPFFPVINQLERAARFERDDSPNTKLDKLEAVLSQAGDASLADAPLYAALLSIPAGARYPALKLTPQRQKEVTIEALTRQLLGLARSRPVVFLIEDAHWIDDTTLETISRSISSIKTAPVLVLITFRPEFLPPWLDQSHVTLLWLNRLPREQVGAMIIDVAGGKELPPELYNQIISKTDGVPLFVEELTKTILESGQLRAAGDRYIAIAPLPSHAIPATLHDSLIARLDRLASIKEIAQIGAALGREFSYCLLAAVAPTVGAPLDAALAQLGAAELIFARGEPPDSTYVFKHALVQEAAYASLLHSKRRQLHGQIADALTERFPEIVESHPELMAHHLAGAGLTERAIEYLQKAGEHAIQRSASVEAIGHLKRALELFQLLPDHQGRTRKGLELVVLLGQAMIAGRGYAAAETKEVLLQAKALIDESTDPAQKFSILYGIWACHYVGGEVVLQRDAASDFVREAERHGDTAALCLSHRTLGTTYVTMGEFAAGRQHLERARALYSPEEHARSRYQYGQDIGATALCYLCWALWHLGSFDRAAEVAAEAVKRAEEVSHPHTLAYTICHARGMMDIFRRRPEETPSYAGCVVSLCDEHGFPFWAAGGRILNGWAATCQGETEAGLELLREGLAAWRKTGARLWLPIFLALEAEAYAKAGLSDTALQVIEEALLISEDTGERWAIAEVLRIKAGLLLATGRPTEEVEALLVNSLRIARHQKARSWELRTACDLARLRQHQGREAEALQLVQTIYDQFTEGFDTADLRDAKALLADLKLMARISLSSRRDCESGAAGVIGTCFSSDPEVSHDALLFRETPAPRATSK
jgi:predicted ATPase/class 3 adenylate cyclase